MADMRFNYNEMNKVVQDIRTSIKVSYQNAGAKLVEDFQNAVASWEGDSKEKLVTLFQTAVNDYLTNSIPNALEALATLLEENAKQMSQADQQIADQIPTSLG